MGHVLRRHPGLWYEGGLYVLGQAVGIRIEVLG